MLSKFGLSNKNQPTALRTQRLGGYKIETLYMQRLSEKEIISRLQNLKGWTLNEGAIENNFELKDFKEALAFINRLGTAAETANHHPELFNVYNKVNIRLRTHDADGITQKDFDLAEKISELR